MTPEETEIAREMAEHPEFRWGAGMRALDEHGIGYRIMGADVDDRSAIAFCEEDYLSEYTIWHPTDPDARPFLLDLADPATQGVVLAMIAETGYASLYIGQHRSIVHHEGSGGKPIHADTPGAALGRAWLASRVGAV